MESNDSSHMSAIQPSCNMFVFQRIDHGSICLDVGCGNGSLGAALIEHKRCTVDGIDINSELLSSASGRGYRMTYRVNLNCEDHNVKETYDCIICADILEHLVDPARLLIALGHLLRPGGCFVISMPNIAFIERRVALLVGQFNYDPRGGIMDKTHLRFYTMKTARELCETAGLNIIEFSGYNLVRKRYQFLRLLGWCFPSLFSIQFIIKAVRQPNAGGDYLRK